LVWTNAKRRQLAGEGAEYMRSPQSRLVGERREGSIARWGLQHDDGPRQGQRSPAGGSCRRTAAGLAVTDPRRRTVVDLVGRPPRGPRLASSEPHRKGAFNVWRTQEPIVASSAMVCSPRLDHTPDVVPRHRWPARIVAPEAQSLGYCTSHNDWSPHRPGAERDGRLLRGRSEPGHDGDERLG